MRAYFSAEIRESSISLSVHYRSAIGTVLIRVSHLLLMIWASLPRRVTSKQPQHSVAPRDECGFVVKKGVLHTDWRVWRSAAKPANDVAAFAAYDLPVLSESDIVQIFAAVRRCSP
jgi:hypothetical protein